MSYVWQRWLADALEAEVKRLGLGVRVIRVEGWENRGRPASTGNYDPNGAHTVHHTGSTTSSGDPIPTLRTLIIGRSDLPGPLVQVAVAFNGDIYVIAAGRANHAGRVGKSGVVGMPLGADGNALAMGDEVDTNGTQTLPQAQITSIAVVGRVVTRRKGRTVTWIHRHQDISSTGKWDIGNRTTQQLRTDAQQIDQEADMQLSDNYAKDKSIGSLFRRLDRYLTAAMPVLRSLEDDVAKLRDEAKDDATKAQADRILARVREVRDLVDDDPADEPQP